jgi:hypothetical protein
VTLWQACALSLDIDPNTLTPTSTGWMAGPGGGVFFEPESFRDKEHEENFNRRQRLLQANLSDSRFFSPNISNMGDSNRDHVRLSEFAEWTLSRPSPWDIPTELAKIAPTSADKRDLLEKNPQPEQNTRNDNSENFSRHAAFFDPLTATGLAAMFKVNRDPPENLTWWKSRIAQAYRLQLLKAAREDRGRYNPAKVADFLAAAGYIETGQLRRILANNLPERSLNRAQEIKEELG